MSRTLVLLAGPSGSGKSRLVALGDAVGVRLDDFYRDGDVPGLPQADGIVDWDDVTTFDVEGAVAALASLVRDGRAEVPVYEIAKNARTGWQTLEALDGAVIVAEGIFAPDLLVPCREAGLEPRAIWLERPAALVFGLRLVRDLREHRKAPHVLVRRGFRLAREQGALGRRAKALGFRPMGLRRAARVVGSLGGDEGV